MLFVTNLYSAEFHNGEFSNKGHSLNKHLESLGIGDIYLKKNKCDKKKINCDTDILETSFIEGKKVKSRIFNFDFGVLSIVARGRYLSHKSAIIKQVTKVKDPETKETKTIITFWLISNRSGEFTKTKSIKPRSKLLSIEDKPLILENFGLTDFKAKEAAYSTEPSGKISAVVLAKDEMIRVSNGKKWIMINDYFLAKHGDRLDILSVYPDTQTNKVFVAIYNYVNPFNKGLDLIVVDFDKNDFFYTNIYNSDEYNYGWSPEIYSDKENIVITAYDSSREKKRTIINKKNNLENIKYSTPPHIEGFEYEPYYNLMTGATLMKNFWFMSAKVNNPKSDDEVASTDYEIASTLSWSTYIQGRIGETQIGVSYMQSKMEEQEGLKGDISQLLSMTVDFNSFISNQTTLRIVTEFSKLNGVAISHYGKNDIGNNTNKKSINKIDTTYWKGDLLLMWERGLYGGVSYAKYEVPGVVGLSDKSKKIVYTDFDENLGFHNFKLVLGYDISSYASRYEVNYSKFYLGGELGLGLSFFNLSNELENRLEDAAGNKTIIHKYGINLSGKLETGFIFQRRFRELKGFGYSIVAGYGLEGTYIDSSQDEEDKDEDGNDTTIDGDELSFEHERVFFKHGPFIMFNLIF